MTNVQLDPIFNLQTVPPLPPGASLADPSNHLTDVTIETARPIVLTQNPRKALSANHVFLPPTANVTVYADEVTVSGSLSFRGRDVVVFARLLGAEDDGPEPASISVDGQSLEVEDAKPRKLAKGEPRDARGARVTTAPGMSARDHPEMKGADGTDGRGGNPGGSVWFCCQKTRFRGTGHRLAITARGGRGGDGQDGQDGVDGGDGVNGKGVRDELLLWQPEPGGDGGDGGRGGNGGQAGQGGKGGRIAFHCIASQPAVAVNSDGGEPGNVGKGGLGGKKGKRGKGGHGGKVPDPAVSPGPAGWKDVGPAPDGHDGRDGLPGDDGGRAAPSLPGTSTMTWGEVDGGALVRMASMTQLQMLFERTRADYLATEPVDYALRLIPAAVRAGAGASDSDPLDGEPNLVVVACSPDGLRIRISDMAGRLVADAAESAMVRDLARPEISMADILEAGGWQPPDQIQAMSAGRQRQALVDELVRISGQPRTEIEKLTDHDLAGQGAVTAFLLEMGIRDEACLKGKLDEHRKTLVAEAAAKAGSAEKDLQGLDNHRLVRLALDPGPQNKFAVRGRMITLRHRLFGTEKLVALKSVIDDVTTPVAMTVDDVLQAGDWLPKPVPSPNEADIDAPRDADGPSPDEPEAESPGARRQVLINRLSRIRGLPPEAFSSLADDELIGLGAVVAFLLQMGIRDERDLDLKDHTKYREVLIAEILQNRDDAGNETDIHHLEDQQLVRLVVEPHPDNKFVVRNGAVTLRDRACGTLSMVDVLLSAPKVLTDGTWANPDYLAAMILPVQRVTLISFLRDVSRLPANNLQALPEYDLVGHSAIAAFLLEMGIRDRAGLKGDLEGHREALIESVARGQGRDPQSLRRLDNQQLVRFALESTEKGAFDFDNCDLLHLRRRSFEIRPKRLSYADVLGAGRWLAPTKIQGMSAEEQRQALVDQICRITHLPKYAVAAQGDYELIGQGAAIAFLLQMGIRDEAGLRVDEDPRDILIAEVAKNVGYPEAYLRGLDNKELVRLAVEPTRLNHIALRGNLPALRDSLYKGDRLYDLPFQQQVIGLAAEAVGYADTWSSIGDRLHWLLRLLKAASIDHPLEPEKEHPQKDLSKALQPSVWAAVNNHVHGLDYYGFTPRFVPRLSLATYLTAFEGSARLLETIERQHERYFAAWKDQAEATEHLKSVILSADAHADYLAERIGALKKELLETKSSIDAYETKRKASRDAVRDALRKCEAEVKGAFGLRWETFFNCLSQLGFANFSEPARALKKISKEGGFAKAGFVEGGAVVGGFAGGAAMVAGPVGLMLNEAATNILNDYGEPVNKNYLLEQIDVIRSDLDLQSELEERSDGFISDTASRRLVVELSKFNDLCKQFNRSLPDEANARDKIQAYIQNITERNRYVDYYNAQTADLLDLLGEAKKVKIQKEVVQNSLARQANPGIPAMTTFVSGLLERAKAECLSDFYLAARAYSFWALEPYGAFYETIRSPGAMTSAQLRGVHGSLKNHILARLESGFGSGSFIPPREGRESSIGVVVVLSKESHPEFFDDLISENRADFELEPATAASTAPPTYAPTTAAWSGLTRPNFDPSAPNPFHGRANVRLTKVRPWIVGMRTSTGLHTVDLIHLGEEQFRRADDVPYPPRADYADKPAYVLHGPQTIGFTYDPDGLSWDPVANTFTPGKLFGDGVAGAEDGDLGFPQPGVNLRASVYAPLGPFAKWRLVVRPQDNGTIGWDEVQAVVIDFHIFREKFKLPLG